MRFGAIPAIVEVDSKAPISTLVVLNFRLLPALSFSFGVKTTEGLPELTAPDQFLSLKVVKLENSGS